MIPIKEISLSDPELESLVKAMPIWGWAEFVRLPIVKGDIRNIGYNFTYNTLNITLANHATSPTSNNIREYSVEFSFLDGESGTHFYKEGEKAQSLFNYVKESLTNSTWGRIKPDVYDFLQHRGVQKGTIENILGCLEERR